MRRIGRILASWFGGFKPTHDSALIPYDGEPQGPVAQSIYHVHQWGACKYNGQYWYARCVALESCTARIAC